MSKKYYAVRVGKKPGIYTSWPEAKKQIDRFPNAIYKSFKSFGEAEEFLGNAQPNATQPEKHDATTQDADTIVAYVDGSFDKKTARYSFGIAFIQNDEVIQTLSKVGDNPLYQKSWQIAGEVFGAIHAMHWAIKNHYKKIIIHYDYVGIEHWALKEWRANQPVSQDYMKAFDKLSPHIEVEFVKVKAHSGVKYNELVDQLAKDALKNS